MRETRNTPIDHTISRFKSDILISLFLVIITLVVYYQVTGHEFINFDDNHYVTENHYVQKGLTLESFVWSFSFENKDSTYWHPLTWLSHILDCHFHGLNAGMHHLTNVILHTANSLLLFLAFRIMTGSLWKSAFIALLFALHPINTDSVAWVAERKNVLSTFFWMGTLLTYAFYADRPGLLKYLVPLFIFSFGLLAKPMLVTLPFVLLLLDYWPLNRLKDFRISSVLRLVSEKIPFLILSGVSIYVSTFSLKAYGNVMGTDIVPMSLRIANALVSYPSYIGKMCWPVNLTVHHPYPHMVPNWQIACAGLFLILVSVLVLRVVRKKPYLTVGWLWFLGTLVPVIGLVQAGLWPAMAERWAYVPLIGLFIVIAWGAPELLGQWRFKKLGLIIASTALLILLAVVTTVQLRHWKDSRTLFEHAIHVIPQNSHAHNNLGIALTEQNRISDAVTHFSEALRIDPTNAEAHNNIGTALKKERRFQEAIGHFTEALRIRPDYATAHYNLGIVLINEGRIDVAIHHFNKALQLKPHYADPHNAIAYALEIQGGKDESIRHYFKALEIDPDSAYAHSGLGHIFIKQGRLDDAIKHFNEALRINPGNAQAKTGLKNILGPQKN